MDLYAFVMNNPIRNYDKLGLRCCIITTRAGGEGEHHSTSGHSMIRCDNGFYMSWAPHELPNYIPGYPHPGRNHREGEDWGPNGHYGEIIEGGLLEQGTIRTDAGREATVVCLDCLYGDMLRLPNEEGNRWGCSWNPLNNCADEVLRAVDEAFDDEPPPCRCGEDRVNILWRSPAQTPRSAEDKIRDFSDAGCVKWRCVQRPVRLRLPGDPLGREYPRRTRW